MDAVFLSRLLSFIALSSKNSSPDSWEYAQYPPQEHPKLPGLAMTHFVTAHMLRPMIV